MAKVFKALYRSGTCPECGDTIEKGDEISILDGEYLHAECNPRSDWSDAYLMTAEM